MPEAYKRLLLKLADALESTKSEEDTEMKEVEAGMKCLHFNSKGLLK